MPGFSIRRVFGVFLIVTTLMAFAPVVAAQPNRSNPSAGAMAFDAVIVRPVSLAATIIGAGIYVVSLPVTLISHSTDAAGERLVAEPFEYTVVRPLGNFDAKAAPSAAN